LSRAFMLRYGLYSHYFPLMALARAEAARIATPAGREHGYSLRGPFGG
jgi:hypothetical protein